MSGAWDICCVQKAIFRQHKIFQDGFTNLKPCTPLGQPKTGVTNVNIAAVAGLIKRDARLTVKYIAHSAGISLGSVSS